MCALVNLDPFKICFGLRLSVGIVLSVCNVVVSHRYLTPGTLPTHSSTHSQFNIQKSPNYPCSIWPTRSFLHLGLLYFHLDPLIVFFLKCVFQEGLLCFHCICFHNHFLINRLPLETWVGVSRFIGVLITNLYLNILCNNQPDSYSGLCYHTFCHKTSCWIDGKFIGQACKSQAGC